MDDGSPPSDQALAARISDRGAVLANAAVAAEVIGLLGGAGIDALLIKGASSAVLIDSPGVTRSYGDVDVLVDPAHFDRAIAVLGEVGFAPTHPGARPSELSGHAVDLVRGRSVLDLHWRVAGVHLDAREAWRVFWSHRLDRVIAGGIHVTCLDDPGVLLVLALHAGADPHQHPKALNDLEIAAARFDVDHWRQVEALARKLSAIDFLASGLSLVPAGRSLVDALGLASSVSARSVLRSQRPPPLALGLDRLAATPGLWSKVRILARELVPTPDGMRYWLVSVNGSERSLAWGYAHRPVHLLTRMPDAIAAVVRARRAARRARRPTDRQA